MKLLTVQDVAKRLSISRSKVYGLCSTGELAHHKIGGAIRITEEDLTKFMSSCRQECDEREPDTVVLTPQLKHIRLQP